MDDVVTIFAWVDVAVVVAIAAVTARLWLVRRDGTTFWAAGAFAALAVTLICGLLVGPDPHGAQLVLQRVGTVALATVPYQLYRFTTMFRPRVRWLRVGSLATVAVLVVWTVAVPHWPQHDDALPAWAYPYLALFLGYWLLLSAVVVSRLWRSGSGEPTLARRRMRTLALSAGVLAVALFVSLGEDGRPGVELVVAALVAATAALFLVALQPPRWLRLVWRHPEQLRFEQAAAALVVESDEQRIAQGVLPAVARLVGARAVVAYDRDGAVVATYGSPEREDVEPVTVSARDGALRMELWTSRYSPYFGPDEFTQAEALLTLVSLASERARTVAREREARAVLEQADRIKSEFVARAAHELRNPVAAVLGLSQTLVVRREMLAGTERRDELEETVARQAQRLATLVEDLLDLSRADADEIRVTPQPVPLRDRIHAIVEPYLGRGPLELDVPDRRVTVDPAVLDRVVGNLVANAFVHGAPPVVLSASVAGDRLTIAVEDAGAGVEPEFAQLLFERFARSDAAHGGREGSGLGLAIARAFAQAHAGDLRYESRPGGGSRFVLELPVTAADRSASAA